jgi:hypothetical protein
VVKPRLSPERRGFESPSTSPALIDGVRIFVRYLREDLENQLRDGTLEDMTHEQARQAIYGAQILEGSLQSDYPELSH